MLASASLATAPTRPICACAARLMRRSPAPIAEPTSMLAGKITHIARLSCPDRRYTATRLPTSCAPLRNPMLTLCLKADLKSCTSAIKHCTRLPVLCTS